MFEETPYYGICSVKDLVHGRYVRRCGKKIDIKSILDNLLAQNSLLDGIWYEIQFQNAALEIMAIPIERRARVTILPCIVYKACTWMKGVDDRDGYSCLKSTWNMGNTNHFLGPKYCKAKHRFMITHWSWAWYRQPVVVWESYTLCVTNRFNVFYGENFCSRGNILLGFLSIAVSRSSCITKNKCFETFPLSSQKSCSFH